MQVEPTGEGEERTPSDATPKDEFVIEVKEVEQQDAAAASEDIVVDVAKEEEEAEKGIPRAEAIREVPPTAEELASA